MSVINTYMKQHESILQSSCMRWFRFQYPKLSPLFFSIPNGGYRAKATAVRMKKEGQVPGVADLFLAVPKGATGGTIGTVVYHGFFIEMKFGKGVQQASQKTFEKAVTAQGYKYMVIRDFDTFVKEINDYLK